jgi:hypothetical protein
LVLANWDVCSLVKKDVGGLQDRVREETEFESIFVGGRLERRGIFGQRQLALDTISTPVSNTI